MTITARMIDAIEHPLVDQRITVTTRAQPWVNELLAQAWDQCAELHALQCSGIHDIPNPYRLEFEGES